MRQFLTVLGVAALAAIAIWIHYRSVAERREALRTLAHALGYDFWPDGGLLGGARRAHAPFQQGSGRRAYNVGTGTLSCAEATFAVTMGDYRYTVQRGKNRHTHRFSFLVLRPPWGPIPNFVIRAEHIGDKLLDAMGFDDIDFESEEFSRRFHVKGEDKRFTYAVVHPRMMEFLLQTEPPKVDCTGGECLLYVSREAKRRIGYLPENGALPPELRVAEYLAFRAGLRDLPGLLETLRHYLRYVDRVATLVQIGAAPRLLDAPIQTSANASTGGHAQTS